MKSSFLPAILKAALPLYFIASMFCSCGTDHEGHAPEIYIEVCIEPVAVLRVGQAITLKAIVQDEDGDAEEPTWKVSKEIDGNDIPVTWEGFLSATKGEKVTFRAKYSGFFCIKVTVEDNGGHMKERFIKIQVIE